VTPPVVAEHDGILVVRDDFFAGGTKARFIPALFDGAQTPPEVGRRRDPRLSLTLRPRGRRQAPLSKRPCRRGVRFTSR
jgi:hypothetical protein